MTYALNIYKHIYSGEKRLLGEAPEELNWLRITNNDPPIRQTHEERAARFQAHIVPASEPVKVHKTAYVKPVVVYEDDPMETMTTALLAAEIVSSIDTSSYDSGSSFDAGGGSFGGSGSDGSW